MKKLPSLFFGILVFFGASWLGIVAYSNNNLAHLEPLPDEETGGTLPPTLSGLAVIGEKVYAANGCIECHTQQVRSAPLTTDIQKELGKRQTVARDYLRRTTAMPGTLRIGQDLSNYGTRTDDANAIHLKLYAPRSVVSWSTMPSYSYLYKVRKIQGQPSNESLVGLTGSAAPKPGYEVVPTEKAKALAAYLLSLNQSYPLPESPAPPAQ
jgi:cytochrome c oxidase cbb3-type subunit 2